MKTTINQDWLFTKELTLAENHAKVLQEEKWEKVNLPHTWNGKDGQDGGGDYYRGTCLYAKHFTKAECEGECVYLEFEGVNASADVYVNGKAAAHHDGGYSTFRVNITDMIEEENTLIVAVDNSANDEIYPQMADFTFYGGIYRNVNLITVPKTHFDLDHLGSQAIKVTPVMEGENAKVTIETWISNAAGGEKIRYSIEEEGKTILEKTLDPKKTAEFTIENAHLWNGLKDPFLYNAKAVLISGDVVLDERCVRFGCRSFSIDPDKGFFLNGKSYPLRGVSRHQDRPEIGNALLPEHHIEDMDLICELGATTIRLAHYQHNQVFYDLCDERGLVIWAEIPYISRHMPGGRENTISQMKELITQNYNHPSIFVWGLSNEITMGGDSDPDLLENHRILNDLVHEMDKTRKTTMAVVSMCPTDSPYLEIPDVLSWNHYFGWYGGDTTMNGPWMDKFHAQHPTIPVGMSEYGAEALNWHTSDPQQGDYTEEYQAFYHEELIKQLFTRDYIWATHCWNMFDFAADARSEGGEDGMNHKGLVTFDRKYKKDAFYAYKAWLSDEPFVHICGKRYVDRVEDVTKVTVYSNLPEVELFANGESLGKKESKEHFFYFEVPNKGETELKAVAGECEDTSRIVKVEKFNDAYVMKETGDVINWFDITTPEGRLSINDKLSDVTKHPMAILMLGLFVKKLMPKKEKKSGKKSGGMNMGAMMKNKDALFAMMGGFTVKRMISMLKTAGLNTPTKEEILKLNKRLNRIKK